MKLAIRLMLGLFAALALLAFLAVLSEVRAEPASAPVLAVTPDSACGARAVGRDPLSYLVLEREAPGQRVDGTGTWVACDRPCPAAPAFKAWTVGGMVCSTAVAGDADPSSPARDRTLLHGQSGHWQQLVGPTRGALSEQCRDGTRTVTGASCAAATHCSTAFAFDRDGTEYRYDARPAGAAVAVGTTVHARAADGSTWPLTCSDGSWSFPLTKPAPPKPAASAPARPTGCGPQVFLASRTYWRYAGPRVAAGADVEVTAAMGAAKTAAARCDASGRLVLR